jgi:GNAT superfamily N-acetyltransferase
MKWSIEIRVAEPADVPSIVSLLADDPLGRLRESADSERYRLAFEDLRSDPNSTVLVAVDGDVVVGCTQITYIAGLSHRGARRCKIEDVRVASNAGRRNIGSMLLDAAEARARAAGCTMLELLEHQERREAHSFYEHLGYACRHRGYRKNLSE